AARAAVFEGAFGLGGVQAQVDLAGFESRFDRGAGVFFAVAVGPVDARAVGGDRVVDAVVGQRLRRSNLGVGAGLLAVGDAADRLLVVGRRVTVVEKCLVYALAFFARFGGCHACFGGEWGRGAKDADPAVGREALDRRVVLARSHRFFSAGAIARGDGS